MNSVGMYYPIWTGKIRLRESHSFGMFLIKKKSAKLFRQISGPHNTCEEVMAGTIHLHWCSGLAPNSDMLPGRSRFRGVAGGHKLS
jgi:hypothetical protein